MSSNEKSVWVLSYKNIGNFGDRLGAHVLAQVLPPNACVRWIHHKPWDAPPEGSPDLLILGLGNSLFDPLLTPELLDLMDRAKAKVGIFGTQYRDGFARGRMTTVIDRLDLWYARSVEDADLYGRHRANVRHLGDWLITAFPLAEPMVDADRVLDIGEEVPHRLPLDRQIEQIQRYSRVRSPRLHPLLCALTSAKWVSYSEQRETPGLGASGKFRSMFMDIFGRDQPEDVWWQVDREAVCAYKVAVSENLGALKREIADLLDGVR